MIRAILIGVLLLAVPSIAVGGNVEIDLLSDAGSINPGSSFHVGLRMKIAPGWHVYWKNPGDSGLPPKIAWRLPKGFQAGPIEWPTPERFLEEELMTYGYHDEVILPVTITPPGNIQTDSVTIAAAVTWLECKDVCLPGSGSVRRTLPVSRGQAIAGPDGSLLTEATQKLPSTPNGWAFEAEAGPRAIVLTFAPREGLRPRGAYLYLDQPMVTEHAAPQEFHANRTDYRLTLKPAENATGNLDRLTGVLVVEQRGGRNRVAVNVDVPVRSGDPAPASAATPSSRPPLLVYALVVFLAGLVPALLLLRARKRSNPT